MSSERNAGYSFQTNASQHPNAEPPRDADGLRTDGPTIEAFTDAGYKAETYPPQGYAVVDSPGWQVELERRTAPATEPLRVSTPEASASAETTAIEAPPVPEADEDPGQRRRAELAERRQNDPASLTEDEAKELAHLESLAGVEERRKE